MMAQSGMRTGGGFVIITQSGILVGFGFGRFISALSCRIRQMWQKPKPGCRAAAALSQSGIG